MWFWNKKQTHWERINLVRAEAREVLEEDGWNELSDEEFKKLTTDECGHSRSNFRFPYPGTLFMKRGEEILVVIPTLLEYKDDYLGTLS